MKNALTYASLLLILAFAMNASASIQAKTCSIQTSGGRYLTAVNGGGLIQNAIHTVARRAGSWEKFQLVKPREYGSSGRYGLKTLSGRYLTAVGRGNRVTDVLHTDATVMQDWEIFTLVSLGGGNRYAIRTPSGHYLTAVDGGGRTRDVMHSNAVEVGRWETFRLHCN